jgi:hypothetical protein
MKNPEKGRFDVATHESPCSLRPPFVRVLSSGTQAVPVNAEGGTGLEANSVTVLFKNYFSKSKGIIWIDSPSNSV